MNTDDENNSFLSHFKKLLDQKEINYEPFKFADGSELTTFRVESDEGHEIEMNARATPDDEWLYMFGRVGNLGNIPADKIPELVIALMKLNLPIIGSKIALNDENDIILMSSTTNRNLTLDEFDEILFSISIAITEIQNLLENTNMM